MDDRGEKIVLLAREMLRSETVIEPEASLPQISMSFKILCFATILSALGASALTNWSAEVHRPINHYEKTELKALLFYAARMRNIDEKDLRDEIQEKFNVARLDDLNEQDFLNARRFLQDKAQ